MDSKNYVLDFLEKNPINNSLVQQKDGLSLQLLDQIKRDFLTYPIKDFLTQIANEVKTQTELGRKILHKPGLYPEVLVGKQYGSIICSIIISGYILNSPCIIRISAEIGYFKVWIPKHKDQVLIVSKDIPVKEILDQIFTYLLS